MQSKKLLIVSALPENDPAAQAAIRSMGRVFAQSGCFEKSAVDDFAAPEYMPEKQARIYSLFGRHISRLFMGYIAKKLGCKERLDARPLAE